MIKLLIADDEPLVQVGIKSLLKWEALGIEIVGTAINGEIAYRQIREYTPEIVICDIKMPLMNGLELAQKCQEEMGRIPLFIFITSYEEFPLIKTALSIQAVDYLIKLELDTNTLTAAIKKALNILAEIQETTDAITYPTLQSYREKFFLKLVYNLFENENQFIVQSKDLGFNFYGQSFQVTYGELHEPHGHNVNLENLLNSSLQMMREILLKYGSSYLLSLDKKHFSIVFHFNDDIPPPNVRMALEGLSMVTNYFNVTLTMGVGSVISDPLSISQSFQEARQAFSAAKEKQPIIYYDSVKHNDRLTSFHMAIFRTPLAKGFEEFNADILFDTLTEIIELFSSYPAHYLQVIDGASNILYLTLSLLPDGENEVSRIFAGYNDGYRSLHRLKNAEQVINWLITLRDGLCQIMKEKKTLHKNNLIQYIQQYIMEHIDERIVLNEIADRFGISPNYLSRSFKKNSNIGFSEYVYQKKIAKAKVLLLDPTIKVYHVAEYLSFDNAFYFSKVFKKYEGITPRDYIKEVQK